MMWLLQPHTPSSRSYFSAVFPVCRLSPTVNCIRPPLCSRDEVGSVRVYTGASHQDFPSGSKVVNSWNDGDPESSTRSNMRSRDTHFIVSLPLWPHGLSLEQQVISSTHACEIGCRRRPPLLTLRWEAICLLARRSRGCLGDPQLLESYTNIS